MWSGIAFINGTLFTVKLANVYTLIPQTGWRMMVVLPVLGIGHLCFAVAMKVNPAVAAPAGIVFTVIPPAVYALWLLQAYPTGRIVAYICFLILFAILLGVELSKFSR